MRKFKFGYKHLFSNLLISLFLLFVYLIPLFSISLEGKDLLCILTFMINGVISMVGIFSSLRRHSISLKLIYWIFTFVFLYFAPLVQYLFGTYPWDTFLLESEILTANLIILLFNAFLGLGNHIATKVKFVGVRFFGITSWLCDGFQFKKTYRVLFTVMVCALGVYSFLKAGLLGIVVPRTDAIRVFYDGDNSAIKLIVDSVIPAFMAYVVAEAAQSFAEKKENGLRFILVFIFLLVCFFPTAIPRYKMATIYGVIFVVLFPRVINGYKFFWLFMIGIVFIFPIFSAFRYTISQESLQNIFTDGVLMSYTDGNYDAYRMLVSAIRYVGQYGSTLGNQLLGVLLFFIPSAIWTSKPTGSGAMLITSEQGRDTFSNVSCPFVGEGYINFGIIGILLFGFILGLLLTKLDNKYWSCLKKNSDIKLFSPYLFLVFLLFFVLRGDLLSGFAYTCGFVVTGAILKKFS